MRFKNYLEELLLEEKLSKNARYSTVIKAFQKFHFEVMRTGPHTIMKNKNHKTISIPNHKEINSKTLRKLISDAGIKKEKFIEVYKDL